MTEKRRAKILSVLAARRPDLTVVLEDIHDAHNVSAVLRSADAVGIVRVHLVYTTSKFPRLGKKSSASATKWVGKQRHSSIQACYAALRAEGFRILGTRLESVPGSHPGHRTATHPNKNISLYDLDLTEKVALVFGNEHFGVSDDAAQLADLNFTIPMSGMIESLNVSVACAVTLYEAFRQRLVSGPKKLSTKEKNVLDDLGKEWLAPPTRKK